MLLIPIGFDPAQAQYRYLVNPAFGTQAARLAAFRPSFSVTVDVGLDVSRNRESQRISSFVRHSDAGRAVAPADFKKFLLAEATMFVPEDIDLILRSPDSLNLSLSPEPLRELKRQRSRARDSLLGALATFMQEHVDELGGRAVRLRWHATMVQSQRSADATSRQAIALLTRLKSSGCAHVIDFRGCATALPTGSDDSIVCHNCLLGSVASARRQYQLWECRR